MLKWRGNFWGIDEGNKFGRTTKKNQRIREHWLIENQNHWTRDVVFQEDRCQIRSGNAAQNFAIIRSIVLNLLGINSHHSPTMTQRMIAENINYLWLFCT